MHTGQCEPNQTVFLRFDELVRPPELGLKLVDLQRGRLDRLQDWPWRSLHGLTLPNRASCLNRESRKGGSSLKPEFAHLLELWSARPGMFRPATVQA